MGLKTADCFVTPWFQKTKNMKDRIKFEQKGIRYDAIVLKRFENGKVKEFVHHPRPLSSQNLLQYFCVNENRTVIWKKRVTPLGFITNFYPCKGPSTQVFKIATQTTKYRISGKEVTKLEWQEATVLHELVHCLKKELPCPLFVEIRQNYTFFKE